MFDGCTRTFVGVPIWLDAPARRLDDIRGVFRFCRGGAFVVVGHTFKNRGTHGAITQFGVPHGKPEQTAVFQNHVSHEHRFFGVHLGVGQNQTPAFSGRCHEPCNEGRHLIHQGIDGFDSQVSRATDLAVWE